MKEQFKKVIKNPLVSGVIVVISGSMLANFINFLFSVYMAQNLSVADNGILQSILSLIIFPALVANAVNPVVVRFAGNYFANNQYSYLRGLYVKFTKFFLLVGSGFFLLYLVNISSISNFFHIADHKVLFFADIVIFLSLIGLTNLAFIQAKLAFGFQVFLSFISACTKLLCGVILISLGYSVAGAVGALVAASCVFYLFSFFPLRFLFSKKIKSVSIDTKEIFKYGIPSVLTLVGLTSFISVDILLVKHLFDPVNAGLYAGLSLVGRVIFFIVAPIGTVMFPIIVRKHANNENITGTFKLAMFFVLFPSIILTSIYVAFPEFVIMFFLKQKAYLSVSGLLGFFGIYITLYSILYLLATFYLSIKKTIVYYPILIGAVLQIALIYYFHESFLQIIFISFIIILLLVMGFLIYYPYATKK
jgi:O-antigen/teichoic acid export membrane protein